MNDNKKPLEQPIQKGKSQAVAWKCFLVIPKHYQLLALLLFEKSEFIPSVSVRTVMTGAGVADQIRATFGWRDAMLSKALKTLVNCGFMRKIKSERGNFRRGFYEINPVFTDQNIKQISDYVKASFYDVMYWPDAKYNKNDGQMKDMQININELIENKNNDTLQENQEEEKVIFEQIPLNQQN